MFATLVYLAALVLANLSVATFGPVVTPINAFLLIGLDLSLRDYLHERWQHNHLWLRMLGLIASAGALSWLLNPASGLIAIASVVAFTASSLVDTAVYHLLRRKPYLVRSNSSNTAAAAVDSILFPSIAFGGFLPLIVLGQFAAKVAGGFLWSLLLARIAARRIA